MSVKALASGVDSLYVSGRGVVQPELWPLLEESKREARELEEPVPFRWPGGSRPFLMQPYGRRGYPYLLTSPDFDLELVESDRFPAAKVQLRSAYVHSCGAEWALSLTRELLVSEVFALGPELTTSRIDVYADTQGWELELEDLRRFVCLGRSRRGFEPREAFMAGRRLTGFTFGRDALVARIYDKTTEIRRRGLSWLPELWVDGDPGQPVWRVEFQYRWKLLTELHLRAPDEALAGVQDLWHYATGKWLSLRTEAGSARVRRREVDQVWEEIRAVRLAHEVCGVVRRRLDQADLERRVQGCLGYLSSLAALLDERELEGTWEAVGPILERYLASRGRDFGDEVRGKRERFLHVTEREAGESAA